MTNSKMASEASLLVEGQGGALLGLLSEMFLKLILCRGIFKAYGGTFLRPMEGHF